MVPIEKRVPFNVLAPGVQSIRAELDQAIARVLDSGWFLMGPELEAFEREFAAYHACGTEAVGLSSGTDALRIGLLALGVASGDEVLITANAGVPPVAAVVAAGARPVFCEVDPHTHTLDPGRDRPPRDVPHTSGRSRAPVRARREHGGHQCPRSAAWTEGTGGLRPGSRRASRWAAGWDVRGRRRF